MRNDGTLPWPASLRSRRALMLDFGSNRPRGRFQEGTLQRVTPFPPDLSVGIAVNWQRAHGRGTTPEETGFQFLPLPRDLAHGEKIQFPAVLRYPTTVGDYTLRLELVQMVAGNPQALQIAPIEKPIQIRP